MSDEIRKLLEDAAATPEKETLKTDVLLNKTFTILDCREVEGKFGPTWVGTLDGQGQTVEAWLNGAVVGTRSGDVNFPSGSLMQVDNRSDGS